MGLEMSLKFYFFNPWLLGRVAPEYVFWFFCDGSLPGDVPTVSVMAIFDMFFQKLTKSGEKIYVSYETKRELFYTKETKNVFVPLPR